MAKELFFLAISLFFGMSVHSQNILADISKYDLDKIENQTIKKTRKLLKTDKKRNLSVFIYYAGYTAGSFSEESHTVDDFLKNFRLWDKYRCYVYDDSSNIVAMSMGNYVFPYSSTTQDNMYIKYITELNPEYVFEYTCSLMFPMYFCYKNGEIIIVHLSGDSKNIVSYPLSELKNWEWLNWIKQGR
jgi:lipopolysaccharide export LptBFGC system permease protein LptF